MNGHGSNARQTAESRGEVRLSAADADWFIEAIARRVLEIQREEANGQPEPSC